MEQNQYNQINNNPQFQPVPTPISVQPQNGYYVQPQVNAPVYQQNPEFVQPAVQNVYTPQPQWQGGNYGQPYVQQPTIQPQNNFQSPVQPVTNPYNVVNPPIYPTPPQPVRQAPPQRVYTTEYLDKRAEGRILFARSNWIGGAMIATQLIGSIVVLAIMILYEIIGWGNGEGGIYAEAFEYMLYSPIGIGLPMILAAKFSRLKISDLLLFEKSGFSLKLSLFFFGFIGMAIGGILTDVISYLLPTSTAIFEAMPSVEAEGTAQLIVEVLQTAAIPAIVEEFAFRGVVLGSFRRYGDKFAIIASAFLFAILHGNILQIALAFPVGLFFGYITLRSKSMWPAIALHFINNFVSCIANELFELFQKGILNIFPNISETVQGLAFSATLYFVYLILGCFGLVMMAIKSVKNKEQYKLHPGTVTCLTSGEKFRKFCFAPTIIITMVIYIGQALLYLIPGVVEMLLQ